MQRNITKGKIWMAAWLLGISVCVSAFLMRPCPTNASEYYAEYTKDGNIKLELVFLMQEEESDSPVLRAGRDSAVRVRLTADADFYGEFTGELHVMMQNLLGRHLMFAVPVEGLVSGEVWETVVTLPMNQMTEGLYITLQDEQDNSLLEWQLPVEAVNYGSYAWVGVLADEVQNYGYFSSFGNRVVDARDALLAGGGALDSVDVIVTEEDFLTAVDEGEPDGQTASVLLRWIENGGTIIISRQVSDEPEERLHFGLQDMDIRQNLILKINNYETGRNSILASNEELKKQHRENKRYAYVGDSMREVLENREDFASFPVVSSAGQRICADWWDVPGEPEVIWEERGEAIFTAYTYGAGRVIESAIPLGTKYQEVYELVYYRIADMLMEQMSDIHRYDMEYESVGSEAHDYEYLLENVPNGLEGESVVPYVLLLVFYIAMLIPGCFLLLHYAGQSKYLWGVLPVAAVIMTVMVYLTGSSTRITEPYCTWLDIVDYTNVNGGSRNGTEKVYFRLSTPTNQGAEVQLAEDIRLCMGKTRFFAYDPSWDLAETRTRDNTIRATEYRAAVYPFPEKTVLRLEHVAAFSNTLFQAEREVSYRGGFAGNVYRTDSGLGGSVQNNSDTPYSAVYLLYGQSVIFLGEMEIGGKAFLEDGVQTDVYNIFEWTATSQQAQGLEALKLSQPAAGVLPNLFFEYGFSVSNTDCYVFAIPMWQDCGMLGEIASGEHSDGWKVMVYSLEEAAE